MTLVLEQSLLIQLNTVLIVAYKILEHCYNTKVFPGSKVCRLSHVRRSPTL